MSGVEIIGDHAAGDISPEDPVPMKNRGVWLDGISKHFVIQKLQLNTNFTINFWIYSSQAENLLFAMTNEDEFVY